MTAARILCPELLFRDTLPTQFANLPLVVTWLPFFDFVCKYKLTSKQIQARQVIVSLLQSAGALETRCTCVLILIKKNMQVHVQK